MNNVVLVGRLTRDPELRYIPGSGTPVATFAIAIDRDYTKKDGTRDTDFIPVEVMGKAAEFCSNYITKGRLVAVQGSIRVDRYEQNGEKKTYTKVSCRNVQALESRAKAEENSDFRQSFEPAGGQNKNSFEPAGKVNPEDFAAIDDGDVPF